MNEKEKEILREMYSFIESLHIKVKILDDFKGRIIDKNPTWFTSDQLARWQESNTGMAIKNLEELKKKIELL